MDEGDEEQHKYYIMKYTYQWCEIMESGKTEWGREREYEGERREFQWKTGNYLRSETFR